MSVIKGAEAKLLVDEFDFSGSTSSFDVVNNVTEEVSTTLGATAVTTAPILPSMKITQNGYVSGVADAGTIQKELRDRLGVSGVYVAALLGTSVANCPAFVLGDTFGANMQIQVPVTGLMTLNGAWGMGSGGYQGIRVYEGTLSATGNGTAYDIGSAGSAGGQAFLFVRAITGTATSASVKVQSSATEGGTYADEATLTFSAVGGYAAAMSGTVNRWLRLNCASLGGATNFTVTLIACVEGVTE